MQKSRQKSITAHSLSAPLQACAAAGLLVLAALASAPSFAQVDPPPGTHSNPAVAAVRTPVAPPSAMQPPAAPMIVAKGQEPSAANGVAAAEARYQRDKAKCESGRSQQDQATCMKEAGAALDEARRHALDTGDTPATRRANAVERCKPLPEADRRECEARMVAGTTEGTAESGGVLRELTVIETKPAPVPVNPPKP